MSPLAAAYRAVALRRWRARGPERPQIRCRPWARTSPVAGPRSTSTRERFQGINFYSANSAISVVRNS